MLRTVCEALRTAVRMASSTLVGELPTISLSRYTWSLTVGLLGSGCRGMAAVGSTLARRRAAREGGVEPHVRIERTTFRLQGECSTTELMGRVTGAEVTGRSSAALPHGRDRGRIGA